MPKGLARNRPSVQLEAMVISGFKRKQTGAPCAIVAALLISACSPEQQYLYIEQREKSPDGSPTAAYIEDTSGGAAVGTGFDVYIFTGAKPESYSERVFSDECVTDVRIAWLGPKEHRISYGARAGHQITPPPGPFWNFSHSVSHDVALRLASHISKNPYLC